MKPRFEESEIMKKAREVSLRIDALEKAKCDCGKEPCECKNCPKCGTKMNKMGCMKMGCGGKMEKAEPGYKSEKITDINPHFVAESGGQTKTGYFTTNGRTIEAEDAPKKKKGKEATDMENLGSRMNPHEGGGIEREDSQGGKSSVQKANPRATMREAGMGICGLCGGTDRTGCLLHEGMDLHACPKFKPL
jgi:hypothetical protein